MKRSALIICAAMICLSTIACSAATVSYSDSVSLMQTDWTGYVMLPKFDTSLGTLTGITYSLLGHVEGNAKFESMDAESATVTMNLSAILTLCRPDLSALLTSAPSVSTSDTVTADDGVIDFGGTSGVTHSNLSSSKIAHSSGSPLLSDLNLFTAASQGETIYLPIAAVGNSGISGAGNMLYVFETYASADATVTYVYSTLPEPSSMLVFLMGISGMAGLMLRKRDR